MPVVRLEGCDYARGIGWHTEVITLRNVRNPCIGREVDPVGVNSRNVRQNRVEKLFFLGGIV